MEKIVVPGGELSMPGVPYLCPSWVNLMSSGWRTGQCIPRSGHLGLQLSGDLQGRRCGLLFRCLGFFALMLPGWCPVWLGSSWSHVDGSGSFQRPSWAWWGGRVCSRISWACRAGLGAGVMMTRVAARGTGLCRVSNETWA